MVTDAEALSVDLTSDRLGRLGTRVNSAASCCIDRTDSHNSSCKELPEQTAPRADIISEIGFGLGRSSFPMAWSNSRGPTSAPEVSGDRIQNS